MSWDVNQACGCEPLERVQEAEILSATDRFVNLSACRVSEL